jgi:hypothetical protein
MLFLLGGCFPSFVITHPEFKMLREIPDEKQRYLVFSQFPMEKQLDIHLAAMNQTHPSTRSYGDDMIRRYGDKLIPLLITHIKKEDEEFFLPETSLERKWSITFRKKDTIALFDEMITRDDKCNLNVTREQIKFFLEGILYTNQRSTPLVYVGETIEHVFDLLNCPRFRNGQA